MYMYVSIFLLFDFICESIMQTFNSYRYGGVLNIEFYILFFIVPFVALKTYYKIVLYQIHRDIESERAAQIFSIETYMTVY